MSRTSRTTRATAGCTCGRGAGGAVRAVQFNAWHYNDDHLWVGLIEELFHTLHERPPAAEQPTASKAQTVPALKLGRAKARKEQLDAQLAELEALGPENGWLGSWQLAVIRRGVLACPGEHRGHRAWAADPGAVDQPRVRVTGRGRGGDGCGVRGPAAGVGGDGAVDRRRKPV